jgi:nucleoid-associated protein YgaU
MTGRKTIVLLSNLRNGRVRMLKEEQQQKGLFGQAIDVMSSRDEKEAAKKAENEAAAAEHKARLERAKREAAEAKARATQEKFREVEETLKRAEQEAAHSKAEREAARAKARVARMERERQREEREMKRRLREQAQEGKTKEARTYVVKSGDNLIKIARELLGDAARWPEIFVTNEDKIKDPNLIYPGQELDMPS